MEFDVALFEANSWPHAQPGDFSQKVKKCLGDE